MSELAQKTLLPPTATPLAKALDQVENRLLRLPVGAITNDPAKVDPGWLDHLAWELSVDVWHAGWSETIKRRVIAASVETHRFKGTPHAVKTVLSALDLSGDIVEWWQPGGSGVPGTFAVQADITHAQESLPEFGPEMIDLLVNLVRGAAPVSRFFEVNLQYRNEADVPIASVIAFGARLHVQPYIETSLSDAATLPVAAIIAANARLEINGAV